VGGGVGDEAFIYLLVTFFEIVTHRCWLRPLGGLVRGAPSWMRPPEWQRPERDDCNQIVPASMVAAGDVLPTSPGLLGILDQNQCWNSILKV
jgi:hypothetical protein